VTLFVVIDAYSEYKFKKLAKQYDQLKLQIGKLEFFKEVDFFSWFLQNKMLDSTLKSFKLAKAGTNMIYPVQVNDKSDTIKLSGK
jgi:hypothetical protein